MSLTFDVVINPIILLLAIVAGALVGFVLGRAKLAKSQSKLQKLEVELMNSHEETLESQRAYVELQSQLKDQAIPVIPMKINGKESNPKEKATK